MAREILKASEAPNDGVRRLREKLRWRSASQIAQQLACDPTAVRRWARWTRTPLPEWRDRMRAVLGIPVESWELPPEYEGEITTRAHG